MDSHIPEWLWIVWITGLHHNDSFSLHSDIPAGKELLSLTCSNFSLHIFVFSFHWSFCFYRHLQLRLPSSRRQVLFCRCSRSFISVLETISHPSKWKRNIKPYLVSLGGFAITEVPPMSMHKRTVTQAPVADLYCLCTHFLYTCNI